MSKAGACHAVSRDRGGNLVGGFTSGAGSGSFMDTVKDKRNSLSKVTQPISDNCCNLQITFTNILDFD